MVPLLNEGTQSASPELARAEVFSGTPQAAALLLRDAVRSCASQERPVQVATAESLTGGDVGGAICTVPGADYAVSTTGVAGPDPADGQPVGTVFIGVHAPGGCEVFERHYDGDRARVRAAASADAIALLARAVRGSASGSLRESL